MPIQEFRRSIIFFPSKWLRKKISLRGQSCLFVFSYVLKLRQAHIVLGGLVLSSYKSLGLSPAISYFLLLLFSRGGTVHEYGMLLL